MDKSKSKSTISIERKILIALLVVICFQTIMFMKTFNWFDKYSKYYNMKSVYKAIGSNCSYNNYPNYDDELKMISKKLDDIANDTGRIKKELIYKN